MLQVFSNNDFSVRTINENGILWFVAKDIAQALEYNVDGGMTKYFAHVPDFWKGGKRISTPGGEQEMLCLTESGLYFFLGRSDKPKAIPYQEWIAGDVVPSIREHGMYATPATIENILANPDAFIKVLQALKEEREKSKKLNETLAVKDQQIIELKPKASYYDLVLACKDLLPISAISKDYGWSARRMNDWLYDQGIQYKQGEIWLLYQKYAEQGYTCTKTHLLNGKDGSLHTKVHTYWRQKGRLFIYDLMKNSGHLPVIERR